MSFDEIMAELSKLSPEQRDLLRARLAELEGKDWMDDGEPTLEQKALIEARIADIESGRESGVDRYDL